MRRRRERRFYTPPGLSTPGAQPATAGASHGMAWSTETVRRAGDTFADPRPPLGTDARREHARELTARGCGHNDARGQKRVGADTLEKVQKVVLMSSSLFRGQETEAPRGYVSFSRSQSHSLGTGTRTALQCTAVLRPIDGRVFSRDAERPPGAAPGAPGYCGLGRQSGGRWPVS